MKAAALRWKILAGTGARAVDSAVRVRGLKTAYFEAGRGEPVVLLHGGAAAGGLKWAGVVAPLAARFRVVVPDLPGYGMSDKPRAPYDRAFYTSWLRGFLDAVGVERASLVGNSLGGAVAAQSALENPARVSRLVLVDAAGCGAFRPSPGLALSLLAYQFAPARLTAALFARHNLRVPLRRPDPALLALADYGVAVQRTRGANRAFLRGRAKALEVFGDERLGQIRQPTLLVWGEDDPFFPLAHAERAASLIPDARLRVICGARHVPFLDHPAEFVRALETFLGDARPAAPQAVGVKTACARIGYTGFRALAQELPA